MHKNAIKAVWGVKNYGTFWKKIMCAFFVRVSVGFGKIGALLNSKVLGTLILSHRAKFTREKSKKKRGRIRVTSTAA